MKTQITIPKVVSFWLGSAGGYIAHCGDARAWGGSKKKAEASAVAAFLSGIADEKEGIQ